MFKTKSHGYLSTWSGWHWHEMPSWTCVTCGFHVSGLLLKCYFYLKETNKDESYESEWMRKHPLIKVPPCSGSWAQKARVLLIAFQPSFLHQSSCFLVFSLLFLPFTCHFFSLPIYFSYFRLLQKWTHFHFFFSKMLINKISLYT